MSEKDAEFKNVLAGAICREMSARDFYRKLSNTIKNPEGKDKFHRLSGDEEGHRKKLESWYKKILGAKFIPDPKMLKESEIAGVKINNQTSALEAIDIAIKAEMHAEEFYAQQAAAATIPELRDLLEKLSGEEHGHYELLQAERTSITGGFYWFDIDSTAFLED